jgi:gliding motility-associated-like protein
LLKFDELSTIPANATIMRAELKLYGVPTNNIGNSCYPNSPYNSNCPNTSYIQRVTSTWNEQTVTWNTQPTTTTANQITIPQSTTQWNWNFTDTSANLVAMVQDMVSNPTSNFGFMMKLQTETHYKSLVFASSDHSNSALHPELIVTYNITGYQSDTTIFDTAICEGNTYSANGFNQSKTGTYYKTLQNIKGCDSLIILNLKMINKDTTFLSDTICEGNTYSENGFNTSDAGIYTQNLFNRFNCDSTVILNLTVVQPPDTVFLSDSICNGETYKKHGFNVSKTDIYIKNLQNRFNCDSTVVLNLKVKPKPYVEISAITENFCEKDFMELEVHTDGTSIFWKTGSTDNPITIYKSGVYLVTAFLGNCEDTASYTVEECPCLAYIPNAFTPNGDGTNDVFRPSLSCYETLKLYKLSIYDRWGNLIFWSSDYATGWDGTTYKGGGCAEGVYNAVIEYTTSKNEHVVKNIAITLLR